MIKWARAMHASREALHRSPGEPRRRCETAAFPAYRAGADSTPTPRSTRGGALSRAAKPSPNRQPFEDLLELGAAAEVTVGTPGMMDFAHNTDCSLSCWIWGMTSTHPTMTGALPRQPDVLDFEVFVDTFGTALTAEAAVLHAAERRRRVGDDALVDADHAELQGLADLEGA